jgi:predicted RNA binding protein YcfA (HicA-like mRNA interferase family)
MDIIADFGQCHTVWRRPERGGHAVTEYWLNRQQSIWLCTASGTPTGRKFAVSVDTRSSVHHHRRMTAKDLRKLLSKHGCIEVRQKGSHLFVRCGKCTTVVPVHTGERIGKGLLASIGRDLAPCLGDDWWRVHI